METNAGKARESEDELLRKDQELGLADRITCPSEFVLESIPKEIRTRIPCQMRNLAAQQHAWNHLTSKSA